MSKFSALMVLAFLIGCGGAKHPLATDVDGGAGATGTGGTSGGNTGGSVGSTGGFSGGTGGTVGGTGGSQGGGTGGSQGGGTGGNLGGILDAGLGGILDSGLVSGCPANPNGQTCGGMGNPIACFNPSEGGAPSGCLCLQQKWFCPGAGGGLPGIGDGGPGMGMTATPCPAGAMGMACTMATPYCTGQGNGCLCFGGTWRCF